ncbi:hypothetical protein RHSIM_Rhsim05G0145300 [Rhododendron simsii]|uniref:Uncharacterized protein n=1 Tax=Rhododendron simsii TaxID=118357 RepID=A0A834LPL1_RHOSS|nr:hypothetical protein RHSIM_Rhsim05G0145300 [Rhododendron simsii]
MKVEKDLFGVDVDYHLQKVDMEYICELKELFIQCIVLSMSAFIIYEGNKGNRRRSLHWKVVQCPKQQTDVECRFYIMMVMRDLIRDQGILSKNNASYDVD